MKKRVLLIMSLCILLLLGGCSKNGGDSIKGSSASNDKATTAPTAAATDTKTNSTLAVVTGIPEREEYKPSDYVTLGNYKGLELSVVKTTVSDSAVEDQMKSTLSASKSYEKTSKKVVEKGDIVNIDYEGLLNGKAFTGGTAKDFDLTIGSGQFIDGFEDGLIGKKVGEKTTLDITFPANYTSKDLAGKAVKFNVTINYIEKEQKAELTDAYVKKNTKFANVEAFRKSTRESLEADNEDSIKNSKYSSAYSKIYSASKISKLPEVLTKYYTAVMNYQTYMMAQNQGMDMETYLKNSNMTADSFNQYVAQYAENYATQDLLIDAIAAAENITVSDTEISDTAKTYMKNFKYDSEDAVYKVMPKSMIKQTLLSTKVMDFVVKNAKVTYTDPTPTPAATATPAASK